MGSGSGFVGSVANWLIVILFLVFIVGFALYRFRLFLQSNKGNKGLFKNKSTKFNDKVFNDGQRKY